MSTKLNIKNIIKLYLGIANDKEKTTVFDSQESLKMLEQQWNEESPSKNETNFDKKALFNKISHTINKKEPSFTHKISLLISRNAAIFIFGMIALSGSIFLGIYEFGINKSIAILEIKNDTKKIKDLILPDGSNVALNANSTIKYPSEFSRKNRTVTLNGEAYFDVVRDVNRPFYVKCISVTVEVLGTSFNMRAYTDDDLVETTLLSGKVKISRLNPQTNKTQSVILTPNHMATFIIDQERFVLDEVDVTIATAWKKGALLFNNETLENVVKKLTRWYDTDIKVSDDLLNKHRLTMSIDSESLEETLEIIKKTLPVDYAKAEGEILIYAQKK